VSLLDSLNRRLPKRFLAEATVHVGRKVEADVIEYDREPDEGADDSPSRNGGVAVAAKPVIYTPPAETAAFPITYEDVFEVKVHDVKRGRRVVAVIELVSPSNKDRPEERDTFALKSLAYLKAGVGLVVIDIISDKHFNLHDEIVRVGRTDDRFRMAGSPTTYAVAYRPVHRDNENMVAMWTHELTVGSDLPTVPLALKGFGCVPLDLNATYNDACERNRIP
jgi:hypothetical protein